MVESAPGPEAELDRTRRRRRRRIFLAAATLLLCLDLVRPPEAQLSTRFLLAGIHLYQRTLSPLLPQAGVRCRFEPTCSRYGASVIRQHGALVGTAKAAWRIARCGPWTPAGTEDPP